MDLSKLTEAQLDLLEKVQTKGLSVLSDAELDEYEYMQKPQEAKATSYLEGLKERFSSPIETIKNYYSENPIAQGLAKTADSIFTPLKKGTDYLADVTRAGLMTRAGMATPEQLKGTLSQSKDAITDESVYNKYLSPVIGDKLKPGILSSMSIAKDPLMFLGGGAPTELQKLLAQGAKSTVVPSEIKELLKRLFSKNETAKKAASIATGTKVKSIENLLNNYNEAKSFMAGGSKKSIAQTGDVLLSEIDNELKLLYKQPKNPQVEEQIARLMDIKGKISTTKTMPGQKASTIKSIAELPEIVPAKELQEKKKYLKGVNVTLPGKDITESISKEAASVIDDLFDSIPGSKTPETRALYSQVEDQINMLEKASPKFINDNEFLHIIGSNPAAKEAFDTYKVAVHTGDGNPISLSNDLIKDLKDIKYAEKADKLKDYNSAIEELDKMSDLNGINTNNARSIHKAEIKTVEDRIKKGLGTEGDKEVLKNLKKSYEKAWQNVEVTKTPHIKGEDVTFPDEEKIRSLLLKADTDSVAKKTLEDLSKNPETKKKIDELQTNLFTENDFNNPSAFSASPGMRYIGSTVGGTLAGAAGGIALGPSGYAMALPGVIGGVSATSPMVLEKGISYLNKSKPFMPAAKESLLTSQAPTSVYVQYRLLKEQEDLKKKQLLDEYSKLNGGQ